jgi:DNA-binding Lrp family transcriptional regulator
MVTAIVLANAKRSAINETAQALLALRGVSEVYSVAGEWDLACIIRVANNEQLASLVTDEMPKLDSITRTMTLIGFRAFSNYDLDRMFSIGLEDR